MLDAAVNAAGPNCGVLAVTILTSLDAGEIGEAWGRTNVDVSAEVMRLAAVSADAGCHGIVCSGQEAGKIRDRFGDRLATLVPGIRAAAGATDDQARVVTPEGVAASGARYAVVGRMVTAAKDRRAAMERVRAALA
jgi:orotidine-5'-phosphate decarboxylase